LDDEDSGCMLLQEAKAKEKRGKRKKKTP